jgi:ribosome-binding factor A
MTDRMRRVNESLRAVLAEAIGELKDPRIGFITVTGVVTTADLQQATVYVSVLGSARKREQSMAGLEAAHGVLQRRIAAEVRLKRTPQLTFQYDPSVEQGVRMSKLIDELVTDHDETEG